MIRFYCKTCLLPDTKPHIRFDEHGVCNACNAHQKKNAAINGIDWDERAKAFAELIRWAKAQKAPMFDAMVPVSGGKDSITQVHRLLGQGLRILAVNVDYGIKTKIGIRNLDCIPHMGAHLMIFKPEQNLHKQLIRIGFEDFGDPDLLSHTLLHALPLHVALQFKVPLALLGENSAFEYGGAEHIAQNYTMTRDWFQQYAANNGMDARKVAERYAIDYNLLKLYDYPEDLDSAPLQAVFSSHFFHWESEAHYEIAQKYGFKGLPAPKEGTYRTYVGIDEKINRIHQYLKVLKFGYGRATDHACEDIRNGRLDRKTGADLIRQYDLMPLGEDYISDFCHYLAYSPEDFHRILESFRNQTLWSRNADGGWGIKGHLDID